jgi:Chlorite dismutase
MLYISPTRLGKAETVDRLYNFVGGNAGGWIVTGINPVIGESLPMLERVDIVVGDAGHPDGSDWVLRGVISNERYVTYQEREALRATQGGLGRDHSVHAALIPIRKSPAWWALAQDERRSIVEDQSQHIRTGMKYLPAIARRLHHCRDLGEPFDFLTWFEYAPADAPAFEELVGLLRLTEEWKYVDREVDIRLLRA